MARRKVIFLLAVFLIAAIPSAAGLELQVLISDSSDFSVYDINYLNETRGIQQVNLTVENVGSIGCKYRLRAVFNSSDETSESYSQAHRLWPGKTAFSRLRYLPENVSGKVDAELYMQYCGNEDVIKRFSFKSDTLSFPNRTVESETLEANSTHAEVSLEEAQNGVMIPREYPGGWKVSSVEIIDGGATAEYDAPLFSPRTNLTYTVVDSGGEVIGETTVNLNVRPTLIEVLFQNRYRVLLAISVILNILLLMCRGSVIRRIKALK